MPRHGRVLDIDAALERISGGRATAVGSEAVRRKSRRDETCRARSRCAGVRVSLSRVREQVKTVDDAGGTCVAIRPSRAEQARERPIRARGLGRASAGLSGTPSPRTGARPALGSDVSGQASESKGRERHHVSQRLRRPVAETQARRPTTTSAWRQGAGTAGRPSLTAVRPTSLKRCWCMSWRRISGRSAASLLAASGSELGSRAVKAVKSATSC